MAFGRIAVAWLVVAAWLVVWAVAERRITGAATLRSHEAWPLGGEALLLTLFAALWFGSLGAGAWWLVFLLLGALMEWPVRSAVGTARIARIVAAGGLLALTLPA
jgi:uncharacterized membrane protein YfcA